MKYKLSQLQSSSLMHSTKKWSFPLRISSVNVTKSAGSFLCSDASFINSSVAARLITLNSVALFPAFNGERKPIWSGRGDESSPSYKNVKTFERLMVLTRNFMNFPKIWLSLGTWQVFLFFLVTYFAAEKMVLLCSCKGSCFHILTLAVLHYRVTEMFII